MRKDKSIETVHGLSESWICPYCGHVHFTLPASVLIFNRVGMVTEACLNCGKKHTWIMTKRRVRFVKETSIECFIIPTIEVTRLRGSDTWILGHFLNIVIGVFIKPRRSHQRAAELKERE